MPGVRVQDPYGDRDVVRGSLVGDGDGARQGDQVPPSAVVERERTADGAEKRECVSVNCSVIERVIEKKLLDPESNPVKSQHSYFR